VELIKEHKQYKDLALNDIRDAKVKIDGENYHCPESAIIITKLCYEQLYRDRPLPVEEIPPASLFDSTSTYYDPSESTLES
jgi:RNA-binding protein YlmH